MKNSQIKIWIIEWMYATEKYVFYFYHLVHFIKFTITPCLRFQRVAKPVVSCLQMHKKFNYGRYHFEEKNFGNLATMTWHWGVQPAWQTTLCGWKFIAGQDIKWGYQQPKF